MASMYPQCGQAEGFSRCQHRQRWDACSARARRKRIHLSGTATFHRVRKIEAIAPRRRMSVGIGIAAAAHRKRLNP